MKLKHIVSLSIVGMMTVAILVNRAPVRPTVQSPAKSAQTMITPPPTKLGCDPSASMQRRRLAILNGLKREGIIHKIATPGTSPRVYVLPRFYTLTFDDKRRFMSTVYAYVFACQPGEILHIFDAQTDKSIGDFGEFGLSL